MIAHVLLACTWVASIVVQATPAHISQPLVKHAWQQIPEDWEEHSVPAPGHTITLQLGLKQNRIDELIKTLYEVSDPSHENYGKYLSRV